MSSGVVCQSISRVGVTEPFELQVARGQITGHSTTNIYGTQSGAGNTYLPMWEGGVAYVYPTVAAQMHLSSSVNAGADLTATILIQGLDASYNQISETLALNGTTPVTTVKSYFRINSMSVATGVPTGNILLQDLTDTTLYARINTGNGRTQMSLFTVPAGYTFYLSRINAYSSLNSSGSEYAIYRNYSVSSTGVVNVTQQAPFTESYNALRIMPRPFSEKTDIQLQARTSTATTAWIAIAGEGFLIKNDGAL